MMDKKYIEYNIDQVKKFVIHKVRQCKIENISSTNFNYIEINDLLSLNYYLNFIELVEIATPFLKKKKMFEDGNTNKLYLNIFDERIEKDDSFDNNLRYFLIDLKELIKIISFELFQKFIDHNLVPSNIIKLLPFSTFGQILVREQKDFSINPHLHNKQEIMDCLYYFPKNNDDITQGTVIYKKINEEVIVGDRISYENFDYKFFEEIKKFEYVPNKLIVWLNNEKSFHGANPVQQPTKDNKKYIFFGMLSTKPV